MGVLGFFVVVLFVRFLVGGVGFFVYFCWGVVCLFFWVVFNSVIPPVPSYCSRNGGEYGAELTICFSKNCFSLIFFRV